MFFLLNLFKNLNLCISYIKQIMNVSHSCNGTNIFIRWKMKCTIQLCFASLNGTFHLSPQENISTIALINIHYLYTSNSTKIKTEMFRSVIYFCVWKNVFCFFFEHYYIFEQAKFDDYIITIILRASSDLMLASWTATVLICHVMNDIYGSS